MGQRDMFRRQWWLIAALGVSCLLLLAACGPASSVLPPATVPAPTRPSGRETAIPAPTEGTVAMIAPAASTVAALAGPTLVQTPISLSPGPTVQASPVTAPTAAPAQPVSPTQPLRAWTVAAGDGAVFVIDADRRLFRLAAGSLAVETVSAPLSDVGGQGPVHLVESAPYLVISSESITRTVVLDRAGFQQVTAWDRAGPVAADPDHHLFMASDRAIWAYDLADLERPPAILEPAPPLGRGSVPVSLAANPTTRELFATYHNVDASPPHQGEFYRVYNLDAPGQVRDLDSHGGALTRPAFAGRAGRTFSILGAMTGFLGSGLLVYEGTDPKARPGPAPLDGIPATDADGAWIYLLRERGLWVLDGKTVALRSVLPFTALPPDDLALAPDGRTLYLFGNGWLSAQPTGSLQSLGIAPVTGGFPKAWTYPLLTPAFQPRAYPSPNFSEDRTAFVLVAGYGETYRTRDGGQTWQFLPALTYPKLYYAQYFSLSPQFARDQTLTAHSSGDRPILRSTDGGSTWQPWKPRIAFVSDRDGTNQVYTANADGTEVRRVTAGPGTNENPAWSPAWTYVAYQTGSDGDRDIYAVPAGCDQAGPGGAQGCSAIPLATGPGDDVLPAWSPDGRLLAFTTGRYGNPELAVNPVGQVAGGPHPVRRLTDDPSGDWRPAWLPDARRLVWASGRSGRNGIYRLELPEDTTPPGAIPRAEPLVVDQANNRDPAANRNEMLAFLSDRNGTTRAYSLSLQNSPAFVYPASPGGQPDGHPAWIDDGGLQLLLSLPQDGGSGIYQADPGSYRALLTSPGSNGQPSWGPPLWAPDTASSTAWLAHPQ